MRLAITFTLFLTSLFMFGQHAITGKIVDQQNEPLPFANVILRTTTSKLPKGTVSDENGKFLLENIDSNTYVLEISMLGFETKKIEAFELSENKTFNITLKEESQTLGEVVIKSKRPVIRQTAEKLIVDIEKSDLLNNSLEDVIKRVPGVIVTDNGINFAGRNDVRILINGKTTDYMDMDTLLRDLPSDNIAKVELVEQPGAEFDAEGSGPIINIILKKNVQLGTHGSVGAWLGEDEGIEYGVNASIASYKNKVNWQLNTGHSSPTWRDDLFIKRSVVDTIYDQATIEPYNPKRIWVGGSIDYYLNDKHSIGFGTRYNNTMSDRTSNSITNVTSPIDQQTIATNNTFNRDRNIFSFNPYYEYKTDAHKLTADFNYINYSNDNINTINPAIGNTVALDNQRYLQDGKYTINTYKVDYKRTFSDDLKVSFGSKFSKINSDNDLKLFIKNNVGDFEFQQDDSNRFLIDENIFALYGKVNSNFGKWSFSGGFRYENSDTEGVSTNPAKTNTRVISKLFPSASLSRKITEKLGTSLAYSYRIRRPNYNSLNSFVTFYDPLSTERGNPDLKPAFTNNFQFNLTFDGQPFFTVGYSDTKDDLFLFISQDDATAQISRTTININERQNWNFRFFGPLDFIKGLEGFTGIIVDYNKFQSNQTTIVQTPFKLTKWNYSWYTQASYKLPWDVNLEMSSYFSTGMLQGQIDAGWIGNLDFSLGKKFIDDKLKVNLGFNKMLNRGFVGTVNYANINANIESNGSRQNIQLRVTYSFGSKFGKKKSKRNSSRDEENRINDNN